MECSPRLPGLAVRGRVPESTPSRQVMTPLTIVARYPSCFDDEFWLSMGGHYNEERSRYSRGVRPVARRKAAEKAAGLLKPQLPAITLIIIASSRSCS